jgi:multidrug efflux pump subunit AcrB
VASTVVTPLDSRSTASRTCSTSRQLDRDGRFTVAITFELGTNLDIAQVQVQNRVAIALPRLPVDVRNIGVTVAKASPDLMMVVHLYSPDNHATPSSFQLRQHPRRRCAEPDQWRA